MVIFFSISVVATIGVHKCYEWVNLAIFTRFKFVFANDNVRKNVLGANFYIEDVFVGYIYSLTTSNVFSLSLSLSLLLSTSNWLNCTKRLNCPTTGSHRTTKFLHPFNSFAYTTTTFNRRRVASQLWFLTNYLSSFFPRTNFYSLNFSLLLTNHCWIS